MLSTAEAPESCALLGQTTSDPKLIVMHCCVENALYGHSFLFAATLAQATTGAEIYLGSQF